MIHLIITAANIPESYEYRKQQYINSIESCLKYVNLFDSYTILECASPHEDFLDQYQTYYSNIGNPYANKGLNEMNHLKSYLQQPHFKDNDSIIKLSGRYMVKDPYFFERVIELHHEYDSIFKSDDDLYVGNGYHTFFYYMKRGRFLEAIDSLEFSDENMRPIEWDVKSFIMVQENHVEIDRLGLIANQGTNSETVFEC